MGLHLFLFEESATGFCDGILSLFTTVSDSTRIFNYDIYLSYWYCHLSSYWVEYICMYVLYVFVCVHMCMLLHFPQYILMQSHTFFLWYYHAYNLKCSESFGRDIAEEWEDLVLSPDSPCTYWCGFEASLYTFPKRGSCSPELWSMPYLSLQAARRVCS